MNPKKNSTWLKNRGYLHITNQLDAISQKKEILRKVNNFNFVSKHSFFPLIHTNIKERRYKKIDESNNRAHFFHGKSNAKIKPLHYATHIDSMIYGFYAEKLQKAYLKKLDETPLLSPCVTAYRRIEDPLKLGTHKSTIHFAHEVFEEIKKCSSKGCVVLKFDIKSFFSSLDHKKLKKDWCSLIKRTVMPDDHYNVFRATTKFTYILKDDLRVKINGGFDEQKLAELRKVKTVAFFHSPKEFRLAIKSGEIKLYKNIFFNSENELMGIPQGLPISATLANLYLFEFDKSIYDELIVKEGCFYRRYSDDIIIICSLEQRDNALKEILKNIQISKLTISLAKTEEFIFSQTVNTKGETIITSRKLNGDGTFKTGVPLTYLGFEYYGNKTFMKSNNLAKFYRRMISAVKSRSKRSALASIKYPESPTALFKRRLYRLYTNINLAKVEKRPRKKKTLVINRFDEYTYKSEVIKSKHKSNYFSYSKRAGKIMSEPKIPNQLNKHRIIFNQSVYRHRSLISE